LLRCPKTFLSFSEPSEFLDVAIGRSKSAPTSSMPPSSDS
jgi:hypothetical protein